VKIAQTQEWYMALQKQTWANTRIFNIMIIALKYNKHCITKCFINWKQWADVFAPSRIWWQCHSFYSKLFKKKSKYIPMTRIDINSISRLYATILRILTPKCLINTLY
jgi:hypothetical protein